MYRFGIPERVDSDSVIPAPPWRSIFKETRERSNTRSELDENEYFLESVLNHYEYQGGASHYHVK